MFIKSTCESKKSYLIAVTISSSDFKWSVQAVWELGYSDRSRIDYLGKK